MVCCTRWPRTLITSVPVRESDDASCRMVSSSLSVVVAVGLDASTGTSPYQKTHRPSSLPFQVHTALGWGICYFRSPARHVTSYVVKESIHSIFFLWRGVFRVLNSISFQETHEYPVNSWVRASYAPTCTDTLQRFCVWIIIRTPISVNTAESDECLTIRAGVGGSLHSFWLSRSLSFQCIWIQREK